MLPPTMNAILIARGGGTYARRNLEALAMDGRVAHLSGGESGEFRTPLSAIMSKRALITGSQLRASALTVKIEIVHQVRERVWPHLGTRVTPLIDSIMPLAQASAAHARMESSAHIGKILLAVIR